MKADFSHLFPFSSSLGPLRHSKFGFSLPMSSWVPCVPLCLFFFLISISDSVFAFCIPQSCIMEVLLPSHSLASSYFLWPAVYLLLFISIRVCASDLAYFSMSLSVCLYSQKPYNS